MRHASKAVLVGSAFLCAASFSPSWSGRSGISFSVPQAQARVGRPATAVSAAGVARRHARRGTYVGAGIAGAAALGTAAALGVASSGYYGGGPYYRDAGYGYAGDPGYASDPGYAGDPYAAYDSYGGYYVPYGSHFTGCLAAPRVGAYASQPWTDTPTCPGY
jgi:hypothetical protein